MQGDAAPSLASQLLRLALPLPVRQWQPAPLLEQCRLPSAMPCATPPPVVQVVEWNHKQSDYATRALHVQGRGRIRADDGPVGAAAGWAAGALAGGAAPRGGGAPGSAGWPAGRLGCGLRLWGMLPLSWRSPAGRTPLPSSLNPCLCQRLGQRLTLSPPVRHTPAAVWPSPALG